MRELCQTHCPPGGSVPGGAVAAVIVAVIAVAVAQSVASVAAAVMVAGFAVLAVSVAAGAVVVHRACRQVPFGAEAARAARALPATPVQAALPARQPLALSAPRVAVDDLVIASTLHVITDARQRARVTRDGS